MIYKYDVSKSPSNEYCETHHILPKMLGGKNIKSNLVTIPARVHYILHVCLFKHAKSITASKRIIFKMACSVQCFAMGGNTEYIRPQIKSSRIVAEARKNIGLISKEIFTGIKKGPATQTARQKMSNNHYLKREGSIHPMKGKKHSEEAKEKMRNNRKIFQYIKATSPSGEVYLSTRSRKTGKNNQCYSRYY